MSDGSSQAAGAAPPGEPGDGEREITVHTVGNKLIDDDERMADYVSIAGRNSKRCGALVRTIPAFNNDTALSRPRIREWMNKDIGKEVEDRRSRRRSSQGLSESIVAL